MFFQPFNILIPPLYFLQQFDGIFIISVADDFGRYAADDSVWRHVLGDNGTTEHHGEAAIRGAVVDDNQFEVAVRLREDAPEGACVICPLL